MYSHASICLLANLDWQYKIVNICQIFSLKILEDFTLPNAKRICFDNRVIWSLSLFLSFLSLSLSLFSWPEGLQIVSSRFFKEPPLQAGWNDDYPRSGISCGAGYRLYLQFEPHSYMARLSFNHNRDPLDRNNPPYCRFRKQPSAHPGSLDDGCSEFLVFHILRHVSFLSFFLVIN